MAIDSRFSTVFNVIIVLLHFANCRTLSSHEEIFKVDKTADNKTETTTTTDHHHPHHHHHHQHDNNNNTTTDKHDHLLTVECTREYSAEKGEYCFDIRSGFGLTHEEFKELNPDLQCKGGLQEGTKVCIRAVERHDSTDDELEDIFQGRPIADREFKQHFNVKMARGRK